MSEARAITDLFEDFLKFFYADAESLFDFQRGFEFLDKELEDPSFDELFTVIRAF